MAVTEQRQLFAPQVESLAEQYAKSMGTVAADPFSTADITAMAPQVAGQQALQQQATALTGTGIGAYAPYVSQAGTQLGLAGTGLAGAETGLGAIGAQYADPARQAAVTAQGTLGGVSPFISAAETGLATAGGTGALGLGAAGAQLTGAETAMAGVSPYIGQAAGLTGAGVNLAAAGATPTAGSIAEYMSPYQQQVIDTTLAEFTRQRNIQQQQISDAAVGVGGYGGGRHGVAEAEFMTGTARDRAMIEAQLQQQGYTQAQAARQADMASRLGIGGAQQQYASGLAGMAGARAGLAGQQAGLAGQQLGLGGAQQALAGAQLGAGQAYLAPGQMMAGVAGQQAGMAGQRAALGQAQLGAGQALQAFQGTDISRAGQVGAMDQAFEQAKLDAAREKARMGLYEPMERLGFLGSGLTGLMGGMGPQYQFATQPNPSPLATALGIGVTGAGVYKGLTS
jgi:hypothetical protein